MLPHSGILAFFAQSPQENFIEYLETLELAFESKEMKHFIYIVPDMKADWTQVEQIGNSLRKIADSGKKLTAYSAGGNLKSLYLLSFAHHRYAAPHSVFTVLLPSYDSYFIKDTLAKAGISVETRTVGQYKGGGYEMFTRNSLRKTTKENMRSLVMDLRKHIQGVFQTTRGMKEKQSKDFFLLLKKQMILHTQDLIHAVFLSSSASPSQLSELAVFGKLSPLIDDPSHSFRPEGISPKTSRTEKVLNTSSKRKSAKKSEKNAVGAMPKEGTDAHLRKRSFRRSFPFVRFRGIPSASLVVMEGPISIGQKDRPIQPQKIPALPYCNIFEKLQKNRDEFVILYINSRGGSADASERLFESIYKLSRIKPVLALLGSVAASGGYYIACAANRIYLSPLTLTGSIGVILLRPDLQKLYKNTGIRKESLFQDPTRDLLSEAGKLSPPSQKLLQLTMDRTYSLFLKRVSTGRYRKIKDLASMAEGRVFTGNQFQKNKMADQFYSFLDILGEYKKNCGFPKSKRYNFHYYPSIKTDLRSLVGMYSGTSYAANFALSHLLSKQEECLSREGAIKNFASDLTFLSQEMSLGKPLIYAPWYAGFRNI